eukprot:284818792_5
MLGATEISPTMHFICFLIRNLQLGASEFPPQTGNRQVRFRGDQRRSLKKHEPRNSMHKRPICIPTGRVNVHHTIINVRQRLLQGLLQPPPGQHYLYFIFCGAGGDFGDCISNLTDVSPETQEQRVAAGRHPRKIVRKLLRVLLAGGCHSPDVGWIHIYILVLVLCLTDHASGVPGILHRAERLHPGLRLF